MERTSRWLHRVSRFAKKLRGAGRMLAFLALLFWTVSSAQEPSDPTAGDEAGDEAGGEFSGLVFDAETGKPIAGATVLLYPVTFDGGPFTNIADLTPLVQIPTNDAGWFRYAASRDTPFQHADYVVEKAGYVSYRNFDGYGMVTSRHSSIEVGLVPGQPVEGQVLVEGQPKKTGILGVKSNYKIHWVRIDADGQFRFWLPPGRAKVTAYLPGRLPETREIAIVPGQKADPLRFEPPLPLLLRGVVIDDQGAPVADARISVGGASARSGTTGAFEAAVFPDVGELSAFHPEYHRFRMKFDDPKELVTVVLEPATWIHFQFVDEQGVTIQTSGAKLRIVPKTNNYIRSDGDHYRSNPLPREARSGRLIVSGYEARELNWDMKPGGQDLGKIVLRRGRITRVEVFDPEGNAVSGANVWVRRPLFFSGSLITEGEGRVDIGGLPPERLELLVSANGFLRRTVNLPLRRPAVHTEIVTVYRGATVRVTCTDQDSQPLLLGRARIEDRNRGTRSMRLGDGVIELTHVPTGQPLTLQLTARDHYARQIAIRPLLEGDVVELGAIALATGVSVQGRAVNELGQGVPGASVQLAHHRVTTDVEGSFEFHAIADGTYPLKIWAAGHESRFRYYKDSSRTLEMTTVAGEVKHVELALIRSTVHERVIRFDDGTPIAGASVKLEQDGFRVNTRTDSSGRFSLPEIPPGKFSIHIDVMEAIGVRRWSEPDHLMFKRTLSSVADIPAAIEMTRGATLVVAVRSADPSAKLPDRVMLTRAEKHPGLSGYLHSTKLEDGHAKFDYLSPGKLAFTVSARGFKSSSEFRFDLRSLEKATIEVALKPLELSAVKITVIDPEGTPVSGAFVRLYGGQAGNTVSLGQVSLPVHWSPLGFEVNAKGFVPYRRIGADALAGGAITATLDRGVTLELRVRNQDGTPFASSQPLRARVFLSEPPDVPRHEGGRCEQGTRISTITFDEHRTGQVEQLERAPHKVTLSSRLFGTLHASIDLSGPQSQRQLELVIPAPKKIRARVTIDGKVESPLSLNFRFEQLSHSSQVPAHGILALDVYGQGRCTITAHYNDRSRSEFYRKDVAITAGGDLDVDFSSKTDFYSSEADFAERKK